METGLIKQGERLDDLERNGLKLIQDPLKFCFGIDAVLLSGFVNIKPGSDVLDLGTGSGVIPVLLTAKTEGRMFYGIEIQKDIADMAARSVAYNKLEGKVKIICGDIKEAENFFDKASFDAVTSNPPYMENGRGLKNPESSLAIARHEIYCTIEDIAEKAEYLLKENGKLFMVHRPMRLVDIFESLRKHRLEPKRIRFVYPFIDREANMVLIEAAKGGRKQLITEKPLIVYQSPGVFSREVCEIQGIKKFGEKE